MFVKQVPQEFEDRTIFMSVFNDIDCTKNGHSKDCCHSSVQEKKKNDMERTITNLKDSGIRLPMSWVQISKTADIQYSELPARWNWIFEKKKKKGGRCTIQFSAESWNAELFISHSSLCKSAQYQRSNRSLLLHGVLEASLLFAGSFAAASVHVDEVEIVDLEEESAPGQSRGVCHRVHHGAVELEVSSGEAGSSGLGADEASSAAVTAVPTVFAVFPGEAGSTWSRASGTTSTDETAAVAKSVVGALPRGIKKHSATTAVIAVGSTVAETVGEDRLLGIVKYSASTESVFAVSSGEAVSFGPGVKDTTSTAEMAAFPKVCWWTSASWAREYPNPNL